MKTNKHRNALQQLDDLPSLTDGLETTLFHEKTELPLLAAYPLVHDDFGRKKLVEYFRRYWDVTLQ